jgi:hypothetical protein
VARRIRLRPILATLVIVSALALFVHCGKPEDQSSASGARETASSSSDAAASADATDPTSNSAAPKPKGPRGPIDPATVGTITGVVHFDGAAPERKPITASSGGCPEHTTPLLTEDVVVENGALANVFVHVKEGLAGWDLPPVASEPVTMNQQGCQYVPHVVGTRVGGKLLVHNSDPTSHNVFIRAKANDSVNPVQTPGSKPVEWTPTKKELGVPCECSLHPWMRAYVCVVDDPWFAVTGADGSFTLAGLPPGDYVLEAWHEKYGKRTAKVSLEPGGKPTANFTFKP